MLRASQKFRRQHLASGSWFGHCRSGQEPLSAETLLEVAFRDLDDISGINRHRTIIEIEGFFSFR